MLPTNLPRRDVSFSKRMFIRKEYTGLDKRTSILLYEKEKWRKLEKYDVVKRSSIERKFEYAEQISDNSEPYRMESPEPWGETEN